MFKCQCWASVDCLNIVTDDMRVDWVVEKFAIVWFKSMCTRMSRLSLVCFRAPMRRSHCCCICRTNNCKLL